MFPNMFLYIILDLPYEKQLYYVKYEKILCPNLPPSVVAKIHLSWTNICSMCIIDFMNETIYGAYTEYDL